MSERTDAPAQPAQVEGLRDRIAAIIAEWRGDDEENVTIADRILSLLSALPSETREREPDGWMYQFAMDDLDPGYAAHVYRERADPDGYDNPPTVPVWIGSPPPAAPQGESVATDVRAAIYEECAHIAESHYSEAVFRYAENEPYTIGREIAEAIREAAAPQTQEEG